MERLFRAGTETNVQDIPVIVSYTVTFNSNGGSTVDSQQVAEGEKATRPNNPTKSGFGFVNWYDNEEYIEPHYNFDTPVTADITLYAKWSDTFYTVTFNSNGGIPAPEPQDVGEGGTASEPIPEPTREGYTFGGWYIDEDCTEPYVFDTPVTEDITLYAKWTENTAIITITVEQMTDINFNDIDGGIISRNGTGSGYHSTITFVLENPGSYDRYEWSIDRVGIYAEIGPLTGIAPTFTVDANNEEYNSSGNHAVYLDVVKNGVPYKKTIWVEIVEVYTVTFDTNGGIPTPEPQDIIEGGTATRPDKPTKTGSGFVDWYDNAGLAGPHYDFNTPVTGNITLYAKWNDITYTVTFNSNGGSTVDAQIVGEGGTADRPPNPTKEYYSFENWYSDSDLIDGYDFNNPVTTDITLYAKWNPIPVSGVTLNKTSTGILRGNTETLTHTVEPSDAMDQSVTWESSAPGVATVTDGTVTAVAAGTAIITVKTTDGGLEASCTITVTDMSVAVTGVTLNITTLALAEGGTGTLRATVQPATATNQNVTWESSAPGVATVSNGVVTAVGGGTATITVRTVDGGYTASCAVTVISNNEADFGPDAATTNIFDVYNTSDWSNAVSTINNNGNGAAASIKNYIINVMADFNVAGVTNGTFSTRTYIKVSLRGAGRTVGLSSNGALIYISNNQTVILRDLTLKGRSANNQSLVLVYGSNAAFTMQSGIITGNTTTYANGGGGVRVNSGTFTMNGGSIRGNTAGPSTSINTAGVAGGGGVALDAGTFTMNGGSISSNTATDDGGGVSLRHATFTMNGGSISSNTVTAGDGGGVAVTTTVTNKGTITMNAGSIYSNKATGNGGGVAVGDGTTFRIVNGTIYGSTDSTTSLRNTATKSGGALYKTTNGTAQRGTFAANGTTWTSKGTLSTNNNTIKVVEGVLQ